MSQSTVQIALADICELTLAQLFAIEKSNITHPIPFKISDDTLRVGAQLINNSSVSFTPSIDSLAIDSTNETYTLVVFDNISLGYLNTLGKECGIKIKSLSAINHRNHLTSYRFQIQTQDLEIARAALVTFSLNNQIEAAILQHTPKLSEPGLLVMDMDSTTIKIECIDEIAVLAGVGEQVAEVTELAMQGKLDFSQSLYQRVATLKDAPETILEDVAKNIPLMEGLKTLITELKKYNWKIAIASGGFTYFSEHLQQMLGLDDTFANTLEIIDGKLTGKVLGSVVDAQVKADSLSILSDKYQIPKNQTVAMGDGANDLIMMEAASLGVAYKAKPIVLKKADTCINHSGLDCMLHWLS